MIGMYHLFACKCRRPTYLLHARRNRSTTDRQQTYAQPPHSIRQRNGARQCLRLPCSHPVRLRLDQPSNPSECQRARGRYPRFVQVHRHHFKRIRFRNRCDNARVRLLRWEGKCRCQAYRWYLPRPFHLLHHYRRARCLPDCLHLQV